MRTDVANLLERLGKRDFQYQDFAERFTDVELWPLFETLIRDPRILAASAPAAEPAAALPQIGTQNAPGHKPADQSARLVTPAPSDSATDLASLFARYGGAQADDGRGDVPGDVHALLQRLAKQLDAQQHDAVPHNGGAL